MMQQRQYENYHITRLLNRLKDIRKHRYPAAVLSNALICHFLKSNRGYRKPELQIAFAFL